MVSPEAISPHAAVTKCIDMKSNDLTLTLQKLLPYSAETAESRVPYLSPWPGSSQLSNGVNQPHQSLSCLLLA